MATAQPATTKRHISQEQVDSPPSPSDGDAALKKQKLDPVPDEAQPDSTDPRDPVGSSDDTDISEVDLEDASDGDSDDLDANGKPRCLMPDGEEFDESHSGDLVEGGNPDADTDGDTDGDGEVTGDDSEEELPIIEGTEVELVQVEPEPPLDGASDAGCYLLRGKGGRVLKLAISENAISEIHTECLELFDSGRLPRIHASDLEVISDSAAELTVHAGTVSVIASYPVKQYSPSELEALAGSDQLETHLLAREKDWCVIEVAGYDILFGSKDLMPED